MRRCLSAALSQPLPLSHPMCGSRGLCPFLAPPWDSVLRPWPLGWASAGTGPVSWEVHLSPQRPAVACPSEAPSTLCADVQPHAHLHSPHASHRPPHSHPSPHVLVPGVPGSWVRGTSSPGLPTPSSPGYTLAALLGPSQPGHVPASQPCGLLPGSACGRQGPPRAPLSTLCSERKMGRPWNSTWTEVPSLGLCPQRPLAVSQEGRGCWGLCRMEGLPRALTTIQSPASGF